VGNFIAWGRDASGFLKTCRDCGRTIYLKQDHDAVWRPYASWIAGDAAQNEWILHECPTAVQEANALSALSPVQVRDLTERILQVIRDKFPELLADIQKET
jgi:hypothetical protein